MATPAPDAVKRLVERFDQDRKVFVAPDCKEEQLRAEFLNGSCPTIRHSDFVIRTFYGPFFTVLGWDMDNRAGLSETFKQVIHEETIRVAGASKAPDYTFRIGRRVMSQRRQAAKHKSQAVAKVRIAR
jgi:hypothetical protein